MITVCFECPARQIGCHAICERYIAQSEQHRKEREAMQREKLAQSALIEHRAKSAARRARARGIKK